MAEASQALAPALYGVTHVPPPPVSKLNMALDAFCRWIWSDGWDLMAPHSGLARGALDVKRRTRSTRDRKHANQQQTAHRKQTEESFHLHIRLPFPRLTRPRAGVALCRSRR